MPPDELTAGYYWYFPTPGEALARGGPQIVLLEQSWDWQPKRLVHLAVLGQSYRTPVTDCHGHFVGPLVPPEVPDAPPTP